VGVHTGENMAHTVFETMELFGLKGCVSSFALPLIPWNITTLITCSRSLRSQLIMHHLMTPCVLCWKFCVRRRVSSLSLIPCGLICNACLIQHTLWLLRFDKIHFHAFIVSEMTHILQLLEGIGLSKNNRSRRLSRFRGHSTIDWWPLYHMRGQATDRWTGRSEFEFG
jgi:hypothetical protein